MPHHLTFVAINTLRKVGYAGNRNILLKFMKFRTDFVTNSSSSSFISLNIKSKTFAKIIEKYSDLIEDTDVAGYVEFSTPGGDVELSLPEMAAIIPDGKEDILESLFSVFGGEYGEDMEELPDDEAIVELVEEAGNTGSPFAEILADIYRLRREILDDMETYDIQNSYVGQGGDSEARFYLANYDDETLAQCYRKIAEEKKCKVEDITEEDFLRWVDDKTSIATERYFFDKITGKEENNTTFDVE